VGDSIYNPQAIVRDSFVRCAESHVEISSTNDRALQLCRDADLETPALVVAERQTAGRGRRGNRWWSPNGALLLSLVINEQSPAPGENRRGLMALAAALGVADAIDVLGARLPSSLQIKWPNDVLIGPRKVAGILVEAPHFDRDAPRRLVIGIGLNVNNRREDAASLIEFSRQPFDLTTTLLIVLKSLEPRLAQAAATSSELLSDLRQRCALTGRDVTVAAGAGSLTGRCRGIADDGALLLDTPAGEQLRVHSGAVLEISPPFDAS